LPFGQTRFAAQLGLTAVLHTWSQTLLDHYHLHCIVTGGGLTADGSRWVGTSAQYLFAVRALSKVFRAKFCCGLQQLHAAQQLKFHGQLSTLAQPDAFARFLRQAARPKWVVYSKRPFAGPQQVLAYLSRYTHRVAISPRRLLALNQQNQTVTFTWKDYAEGARHKTMTLEAKEFLRRFCLHLLPKAFVKIRHFGFLSNRQRQAKVAQARTLLKPGTQVEATQEHHLIEPCVAQPAMPPGRVCPHCGSDRLWLVQITPAFWPRSATVPTLDSS